jgi:transposase
MLSVRYADRATSFMTDTYIQLLQQEFNPFIEALKADGYTNLIFQQDNARPHTAKKSTEFLNSLARKHGFTIMNWLANSPDLSPIENLWAHLKDVLRKQYPDTKTLRGSPETIKMKLCERLHKIWWDIKVEVLQKHIESMPERVQQVLDARGWYTKY